VTNFQFVTAPGPVDAVTLDVLSTLPCANEGHQMSIPKENAEVGTGALSVADFCRMYDVGQTFTYQQIKDGTLRAVKAGGRTLILRRDAEAWALALPPMRTAR
jgi:hypothetical protein